MIYARVSSKEQEKEGFSIPAQLKLLNGYAAANGFVVAQEYIDVETAKQTGRTAFGEMVAYLKAHPSIRVMLIEKTDRLYRNLKDWVTVDELDVEMHFPKEGVVLSRESRSLEKFMHGIKVLMAKNYIDNLSEEARKGMQEKAEQGIWPTKTPLGYRNVTGPDGKKIIATDAAIAPLIAKMFDWYARGDISPKEAARKAHAAGLLYPKSGAKVPVSTVHTILRNRLYTGWFEWNGKLIEGKHEALVPVELWERVQGVLDGRFAKKAKRGKHDFAFSGLIACHACGCSVVGEIKKARYVYYHCTGYADKCQGNPASCRRKYVREEVLEAQFTELLGRLKFDDEVLEWVRDALHASHADERREHEEAIRRHQTEFKRLQDRINAMYVDKLDGLVETAFFERMSNQWREEQNRSQREIERHQNADKSYKDKSSLLTDIAVHLAAGQDWRGFKVKAAAGVVYFAFERAGLTRRRVAAHAKRDGLKNLPIAVAGDMVDLIDQGCVEIIVNAIKAAEARIGPVGLIILDTYGKGIAAGGGDEDKAQHVNLVAANLKAVHEKLGHPLHIALIGHTGWDEKRERGSSALRGHIDLGVLITANATKTVMTVKIVKANDQAEDTLTTFGAEVITVGHDEDGAPRTANIVSARAVREAHRRAERRRR